jgi:hypothetical protein
VEESLELIVATLEERGLVSRGAPRALAS